jgi:putative membrane-bound dehydrogenase-like protein
MLHPHPPRRGRSPLSATTGLWALALALVSGSSASIAQVGPEESARQLKPAPGLKAELWAAEPMVVNPTTIDVDSRGRVWVTEGLNYRLTRGGNRQFQRVEDADKIKILEDTDGDGKADKMTVFADKIFPVPMGIAVEEIWSDDGKYRGCKVYVGNSPDLLVLEDTDGDDKADRRYPLLTGFGGVDSDHGVHGMVLGLDGKLYFTHGDGCCSVQPDRSERTQNFNVVDRSGRHVASDQLANTLRVNRDGTQFEVIADRQRNNYETCLNSFGNGFTSDNDDDGNRGSRVIWVMDGGNYGYRTPGSPRHWGEDVPGIVPKLVGTGNGSPCGVMVYEGDLFPEEYRGAVLEAEAGPRVINHFPITRKGAAFRTEHNVMLASDDPWFRPVDVCASPDGSLLVADWYDAGVGGHAFRDQTTGRIYRIVPEGAEPRPVRVDFSTVPGLIAGLKSPNVATRDVARRLLIARSEHIEVKDALEQMFADVQHPEFRARALWVLSQGRAPSTILVRAMKDEDPRIREQAVRIVGRDVSRQGQVERMKGQTEEERRSAETVQAVLLPFLEQFDLDEDPDAGVRRELILALRNLPTDQVGDALRKLASRWDGQDRWYLEALGLALRHREPEFLRSLFDGSLYGDLGLDSAGKSTVALPPYFPIDRNEAFLSVKETLPTANALSKTLGLAWELHRVESLPLIVKLMPALKSPELQQAADDVIMQVEDPAGATILAETALGSDDPLRKRQALGSLARKLDGQWRGASGNPKVVEAIQAALAEPGTRIEGLTMAGATGDRRYAEAITKFAEDADAPAEVRVAAVEAMTRVRAPKAGDVVQALIDQARDKKESSPAAEAAVRSLPRLGDARDRLRTIMLEESVPLGLRREALRTLAVLGDGGNRLIAMAREKTLPEALRTEAATALRAHPDRGVRDQAQELFPIRSASGQALPPFGELIRRDGDAGRGQAVFFRAGTNACGSCHRVQGRGQWIGPDLSTIGTKYGRDQLLRSVLNPSESISYNFHSVVLALSDGRVLTGLPVEDTPDRVVLKLADGQRVSVRHSDVEDRRLSDVSLMPEGLAESMSEQDLVDLLAYLTTLRQPVSIVGLAQAVGPLAEPVGKPALDPAAPPATDKPVTDAEGKSATWRRVTADAEGRIDLSPLVGAEPSKAVYLLVPVTSPTAQDARLVLDTKADVRAWLDGRPLELSSGEEGSPRSATAPLPEGTRNLLIRLPGGAESSLVATFVADQPVEFSAAAP